MSRLRNFIQNVVMKLRREPDEAPSKSPAPPADLDSQIKNLYIPSYSGHMSTTGETQKIKVLARLTDGTDRDVTAEASWSSIPPDVLEVSNGVVRAVGTTAARVELMARYAGLHAAAVIAVRHLLDEPPEPDTVSISIQPENLKMQGGWQQKFKAFGTFFDGFKQWETEITKEIEWTSSASDVITIDNNGVAEAQQVSGSATISARKSGVVGSTEVKVTWDESSPQLPDLRNLSIGHLQGDFVVGMQKQFTVIGYYADESQRDISSKVAWFSTSAHVASVDSTGMISFGPTPGKATITATEPNSGMKISTNIEVLTRTPGANDANESDPSDLA